jgi:hypothetical protein
MTEGLGALVSQIAQLKLAPDADIDFLTQLETMVLARVRMTAQAQQQQPAGAPTPGAPAGPGPAPAPVFPSPPGGGVPGVMTGAPMPPVDELRRLMAVGGGR